MRRGQVDVHVVLEDLLEEALPVPQFELLGHVHVWKPLAALALRWRSPQEGARGLIQQVECLTASVTVSVVGQKGEALSYD